MPGRSSPHIRRSLKITNLSLLVASGSLLPLLHSSKILKPTQKPEHYYPISNQIQANSLPTTAQQPHPHHPRGALRVWWVKIHTLASHTIQLHVIAEYIKRGEEAFCDLRSCEKKCSSRVSACSCRVPRIFEIPTIFPSGHAAASCSTSVSSCQNLLVGV